MRWLKLFEGFSDPLFRELTEEEWSEFDQELDRYNKDPDSHKPFVDFPEKLFLKLRDRSTNKTGRWFLTWKKKYGYGYGYEYYFNPKYTGVLWINGMKINDQLNYVTVWMLDDEWFMVRWEIGSPYNEEQHITYYKCDQFEGLVELLKVKEIIK